MTTMAALSSPPKGEIPYMQVVSAENDYPLPEPLPILRTDYDPAKRAIDRFSLDGKCAVGKSQIWRFNRS